MKRYLNFDIAKAICIILVVIGHYYPDNSPIWYSNIRDVIYSFHMPLFMFASGFVYIATKKVGGAYFDFVIKKFKRLMIPYFVTSFLVITIKLLSQGNAYVENPVCVMSYLKVFYYPEAGFFLWFIWALWWMFVFVPFFRTKTSRFILLILSVILHFYPVLSLDYFCINQFQRFLVYFVLGCVVFDSGNDTEKKTYGILTLFFVLINLLSNYVLKNQVVNFAVAVAGVGMIVEISNFLCVRNIGLKGLLTVATSSYIIYLFHTTFEGFAKAIIKKVPMLCDGSNSFYFSIGALVVIACGVIFPILLNRYMLSRFQITKLMFGLK